MSRFKTSNNHKPSLFDSACWILIGAWIHEMSSFSRWSPPTSTNDSDTSGEKEMRALLVRNKSLTECIVFFYKPIPVRTSFTPSQSYSYDTVWGVYQWAHCTICLNMNKGRDWLCFTFSPNQFHGHKSMMGFFLFDRLLTVWLLYSQQKTSNWWHLGFFTLR